jgi:peptide/nickel transport system ATP-binding protein
MTALLEARHITKIFGGGLFNRTRTVALEDFSMAIGTDTPSITAVVGESGSGKTTLARILLGVISPTTGTVLYKGKDLQKLSGDESRSFMKDIQVIFQDPFEVYNPFYRVDHVLTTPIDYLNLANSREAKWRLIEEALETVGLRPEETLGRYPHQLSGGQRQRVMVARALIIKPRMILADEPVSMIDASLRATVLGSLQRLKEEFGISIVYITHDLATAYQIGDNIIVLYRGAVVEAGSVDLVVRKPNHPYTRLLVGSIPNPDPDQP